MKHLAEYDLHTERLRKRLSDAVALDDLGAVEQLLEIQQGLLKRVGSLLSGLRYEQLQSLYPSQSFLVNELSVLAGMERHFFEAWEKSLATGSRKIQYALLAHVREVIKIGIETNSTIVARGFINIVGPLIRVAIGTTANTIALADHLLLHLSEIIEYVIPIECKRIDTTIDASRANIFYEQSYTCISSIAKVAVDAENTELIRVCSGTLDKLIRDEQIDIESSQLRNEFVYSTNLSTEERADLKHRMFLKTRRYDLAHFLAFGIQAYLWHRLRQDKVSGEFARRFNHFYKTDMTPRELIAMLVPCVEQGEHLFRWDWWGLEDLQPRTAHFIVQPSDWLRFGLVILLVRISANHALDLNGPKDVDGVLAGYVQAMRFWYDRVSADIAYLKSNSKVWFDNILESNLSEADYAGACDTVLSYFEEIKNAAESEIDELIVSQALSTERVNAFREAVAEFFLSRSRLSKLFKHFSAYVEVSGAASADVPRLMYHTYGTGAKIMFVENEQQTIYGLHENLGYSVVTGEENMFANTLVSNRVPAAIGKFPDAVRAIEAVISACKSNEKTPNLILVGRKLLFTDMSIQEEGSPYEAAWKRNFGPNDERLFEGFYNDVPVFALNSEVFANHVSCLSLPDDALMKQVTDPDWYESRLRVEVREIAEEELESLIASRVSGTLKNRDGTEPSIQEARTILRKSVYLAVEERCSFQTSASIPLAIVQQS